MRRMIVALSAALLLGANVVSAEEWPQYLGPRRDGISKETGVLEKLPEGGLKKVWSATVGIGYSSPVAVDGKVYLFSTVDEKDTLQAFDAESGKVLWTASYNGAWTGQYPGARCSPLIEGDRIYTYGGAGDLVCWELATGKLIWQMNVLKETNARPLTWGEASNPVIDGNRMYVQGGKNGAFAVAVDKRTGKVIWKSEKGLGGYAQTVLADVQGVKQLIVFAGDAVYGLNPETGKSLWKFPWKTSYDVNAMTPVYRDGYVFIASDYGRGCAMLKLAPSGFEKVWETKEVQSRFQNAILEGDVMYVNTEGTVKCLSWPDGAVKWQNKEFKIDMGGALVRVGDKLVMLSQSGKLGLAKATPDGFTLLGQSPMVQGREVWSSPLIYRGKVYAKGATDLVCAEFAGK